MIELFEALTDPEVPFIRYAIIAGLLSSISFGVIGAQVVVRRISSMAGAVGMATGLLTIPSAVSSLFVKNLKQMMIFSALFTALFTTTGIGVSYSTDLPSGSMIIVVAGAIYFIAIFIRTIVRKIIFDSSNNAPES